MSTAIANEHLATEDSFRPNRTAESSFDGRSGALCVIAIGTVLSLISFAISQNNGTDALARASLTADLVAHPKLKLAFGDWPPFHFWLMAALAYVIRNVEAAARLLSLATGLASLWLFWQVTRQLYAGIAVNLSLLVFALYSLRISYSVTSSSEAPFLFFVLLGILYFFFYSRSDEVRWIALSGLSLTIAAGIRYEAWVVLLGATLALLVVPPAMPNGKVSWATRMKGLVIFWASGGIWPVFWMAYCWLKWGHPLFFVAMNHGNVARTIAANPTSALYKAAVLPGSLLITLSPLAFVAALYALWLGLREPRIRQLGVIALTLALVQSYQVASGGVMAFARYTITLGTFLAIVSGLGLESVAQRYFPRHVRQFYLVAAIGLFMNLALIFTLGESHWKYSEKFGAISPRVRFPHYIDDLAAVLAGRTRPDDSILIDDYNVQSNIIAAAVGLPLIVGDRAFLVSTIQPSQLNTSLNAYVASRRPRFLVYSDRGALRSHLGLPAGCTPASILSPQMKLDCIFTNEIYKVYEISYPQ